MTRLKENRGFTLIEILLVVIIIGILLAVIVPRAWRANIDSKYGLVRQAASELASFATEWAENEIIAQLESSTATLDAYFQTLTGGQGVVAWCGGPDPSNWNVASGPVSVTGRSTPAQGTDADASISVQGIVPPEKQPRNPFNGASYFVGANDGASGVIPGALAFTFQDDTTITAGGNFNYYAFLFHGTDSADTASFYASQDAATETGLRNGVFAARYSSYAP